MARSITKFEVSLAVYPTILFLNYLDFEKQNPVLLKDKIKKNMVDVDNSSSSNKPNIINYNGIRAYVTQTKNGATITLTDYLGTTIATVRNGDSVANLDEVWDELENKVDKEKGKGLSTNDFTADYKLELDELDAMKSTQVNTIWDIVFTD